MRSQLCPYVLIIKKNFLSKTKNYFAKRSACERMSSVSLK